MSFRLTLRAGLAALSAAVLATAVFAVSSTLAAPAAPAAKGDAAKGAAKYKTLCVACHKPDGTGGYKAAGNPTPNWTLKKTWDATRTDAYLRDCITNGKIKSGMVAWGKTGVLKPAEIEDMIAHIHTIKAKSK
jgi:mono/diheme cytochrome c family protein